MNETNVQNIKQINKRKKEYGAAEKEQKFAEHSQWGDYIELYEANLLVYSLNLKVIKMSANVFFYDFLNSMSIWNGSSSFLSFFFGSCGN